MKIIIKSFIRSLFCAKKFILLLILANYFILAIFPNFILISIAQNILLAYILITTIHEISHLIAAIYYDIPSNKIQFLNDGSSIIFEFYSIDARKIKLISVAGILGNFITIMIVLFGIYLCYLLNITTNHYDFLHITLYLSIFFILTYLDKDELDTKIFIK